MIGEAGKTRVAAAIQRAEASTAGEIFCVIAKQSGDYTHVPLAWAAGLALCVPLPFTTLTRWPAPTVYLIQIIVFLAAMVVLSLPGVHFRIVPRRARHRRAHQEALRQFRAQGIDKTAQRTGVLIFASAAERYVEIVADAGINDRVGKAEWDGAIAMLVAAIKDGRAVDGFVAAIEQCGAILARHFPPGALPRDELPDKLLEI